MLSETISSTHNAKTFADLLADATSTTAPMFKNDLEIAMKILTQLLDHENSESDLNLTSEQDRNYLPVRSKPQPFQQFLILSYMHQYWPYSTDKIREMSVNNCLGM